jgi:hypothetical protein
MRCYVALCYFSIRLPLLSTLFIVIFFLFPRSYFVMCFLALARLELKLVILSSFLYLCILFF